MCPSVGSDDTAQEYREGVMGQTLTPVVKMVRVSQSGVMGGAHQP